MPARNRKAFTMVELVFVVVVIGILVAIAVPKFAMTRNDSLNIKGKTTLAAVRNSISTERQRRILRGDFLPITDLSAGGGVFSTFSADKAGNNGAVLEYPPTPCSGTETGCWIGSGATYTFYVAGSGTCVYTLGNNKLTGTCSAFD